MHLENAAKLVREFPVQQFVLGHMAKPAITKGTLGIAKRFIGQFAGAEQDAILGGTCARVYGVGLAGLKQQK